jgi:uncharacterized membrane protein
MKTWLLNLWDRLRNGLWFVPAVGLVAAIVGAAVMLYVDELVRIETVPGLGWATTTGPSARAMLAALAGGLVTVTGVVFSVTMLTLAQTSSMFGSRLLRSFLNHNISQATLALFLGTSVYCFIVLRSIQEVAEGTLFAPHLSLMVGLLAGLASLAMFVWFIHHVAVSIQAQNVVRNVAYELEEAVKRLFPEKIGKKPEDAQEAVADLFHARELPSLLESCHDGYIQAINGALLLDVAGAHDLRIRLLARPGDFICVGMPIARLNRDPGDLADEINECFLVGAHRTPRQDAACAVFELVEVAVRALSPGINDPHTAIACIDYLGASLVRAAERAFPSPVRCDDSGEPRLYAKPFQFSDLLNAAVDEIRQYGRDSASVTLRLVEMLTGVARRVTRASDRDAILRQAAMIERGAEAGLPEKYDRADLQERLRVLREVLTDTSLDGE